jgi:hypothetical protein
LREIFLPVDGECAVDHKLRRGEPAGVPRLNRKSTARRSEGLILRELGRNWVRFAKRVRKRLEAESQDGLSGTADGSARGRRHRGGKPNPGVGAACRNLILRELGRNWVRFAKRVGGGRDGPPPGSGGGNRGRYPFGLRDRYTTGRLQPSLTVHLGVPQPSPPSQEPDPLSSEGPQTCTEPPFAVPPTARSTWPPGTACSDRRHRPPKSPRFDRISE